MFVVTHSECLDERGVTFGPSSTFSQEKYQLQIEDDDVTKSLYDSYNFSVEGGCASLVRFCGTTFRS